MSIISVCLSSDALATPTIYLGFSYLGRGVSPHGCSSKAEPLLLTLNEEYLLTATLSDLQCGIAPLGPPEPVQPQLLGRGVAPPGRCADLEHGVAPLVHSCTFAAWHSQLLPLTSDAG